ncbi:hypothetical protein B0T16DRAFT_315824 [Cercophora newfieldiana]|uniref:Rhodopsin domain-containing protein n=1 Tax=Cercophora newfieldiana TaxID=92897 RepID=A0AA39YSF3_9PEZI|nr:hypothetical protein B0T16DRAFT_315824 [Cercophora newfieldiana]
MSAPEAPLDPALYESRAHIPITVVTVVLTLASTAVGLRTYTRAVLLRQFGLDDATAILALVLAMGSGIMVASNTLYGAGRHIQVVDLNNLWKYFRTFYVSIVLYNGSLTAIKIAFLLQYYRILSTQKMRRIILAALTFVGLWSISQLLVTTFTCTPIEKFWKPEVPGTCIPNLPFWYINAAGNILTDVIVFVVPLPALGSLNLQKSQKLMLLGIFSLGFFTCAISIIRIQYLKLSPDVTWDNVESSCWSISELCSGIICACLPTLRPLLIKVIPSMGTRNINSNYKQHASGRDGTFEGTGGSGTGRMKSVETSSSRGIVYPEDIELQGDSDSDKGIQRENTRMSVGYQQGRAYGPNKLGLQPEVRTEIATGVPRSSIMRGDRGIEVKRDFQVTKGFS